MNEGYIKFDCKWEKKELHIPEVLFQELRFCRTRLHDLGLIGVYPDGIGFGNISVRFGKATTFLITGSATGQFHVLDRSHYAKVDEYDFSKNSLSCIGLTKASAESLTHAAVYEAVPDAGAVVHIHHLGLWRKLLNKFPTTPETIAYGTPEMAIAIGNLAAETDPRNDNIIIMGGHREGILAFGATLPEVTNQLIKIYSKFTHD